MDFGAATGKLRSLPVTGASGTGTVLAGVTGKRIRCIGGTIYVSAATQVKFLDSGGDLTGAFYLNPSAPLLLPAAACGWFDGTAGADLQINSTAAGASVAGQVILEVLDQ